MQRLTTSAPVTSRGAVTCCTGFSFGGAASGGISDAESPVQARIRSIASSPSHQRSPFQTREKWSRVW